MAKQIKFNSRTPEYAFLSNFYPSPFVAEFRGKLVLFRSVEHYYQAHKTKNKEFLAKIINAPDGSKAKYWGSAKSGCPIVEDFDKKRKKIMHRALRLKFSQNPSLYALFRTLKGEFIEDAPWDDYFGTGRDGSGKQVMGKLLDELHAEGVDLAYPEFKFKQLSFYGDTDNG